MQLQIGAGDLLAQPPLDTVFNNYVGNIAAIYWALNALGFLVYGLYNRERRWIVPAMLLGGALTSIAEPFLDVVSGCLHPIVNQHLTVFRFMGRDIPLWVTETYALYYGGFGSLNLLAVMKGISRRAVAIWFLAPVIGDVIIETVNMHFKLYLYYGNQAMELGGFPVYQAAGNSTGELMGVMILFFLRPYLHGWRWFPAALIVMPLGGFMGWNAVGWPMYYALPTDASQLVVQSCGVLTWALALIVLFFVAQLLGKDSPLRETGKLILS
jgi:hypothetical protein